MAKLPFGMLPGHWGLKGKTREIARAEYELTGYELERKLLDLNSHLFVDRKTLSTKYHDLDLKYNIIDNRTYLRRVTELISDPQQKALAILTLDHQDGTINDVEYEKQTATLKGEPWVVVLNMDFASKTALEGSFELDWNDLFVEKLITEGYTGPTPDIIVNQWFMEVCRNIAMEEFDGTGDFTADSEANLDAVKRWASGSESLPGGRKGHR